MMNVTPQPRTAPSTSAYDQVDPELRAFLDHMPGLELDDAVLPTLRKGFAARVEIEEDAVTIDAVETRCITVPGRPGHPDANIVLHVPRKASAGRRGAIMHMHGGGYVSGSAAALIPAHRRMAMELDCVLLSVDYRLAPETRFPGAIEDCYASLAWLFAEADTLGVDRERIGVMGESAGGGLAAALALLARDRGEYPIAFQHLVYPMIDDRTCVTDDPNAHSGAFVWTLASNRFGWKSLLGVEPGGADISPYAAAARASDLHGLPPTFINCGALDLFVDENIAYAHRLVRAGVATELHIYPGAYHGFHLVRTARTTLRAIEDSFDALRRALAGKAATYEAPASAARGK